jgi:hypothetical protein
MYNLTTYSHVCTSCNAPCTDAQRYCPECGCILLHALRDDSDSFLYAVENDCPDHKWATAYFHRNARLSLQLEGTQLGFNVSLNKGPVVIGRRGSNCIPHVDLGPYAGEVLGVSRQHVRIERDGDTLVVVDLESHNGTYLNGEELKPSKRYQLHNGDALQLGHMLLRVEYC